MAKRITVVVSQGQSSSPDKRRLEEEIVTALILESGLEVTVIPHLYDLKPDGTGMLALQGIAGDMIVLSWLYERAARWTLDRHSIRGQVGQSLIVERDSEEDDEDDAAAEQPPGLDAEPKTRVSEQRRIPARKIYCIELRAAATAQSFIEEVKRIAAECRLDLVNLGGWIGGQPQSDHVARYLHPTNTTSLPLVPAGQRDSQLLPTEGAGDGASLSSGVVRIPEEVDRRWYPVIDFSRCTNCMECIDFCLFGVYGVDPSETIVVEQPDNCRKGCPACSRVCPENAILFPQHKTPAIAGAPVGLVSLKIDLSKLFGAPQEGRTAAEIAAIERDEQLLLAGRQSVGMSVRMPRRQVAQPDRPAVPKDELDSLLDALDEANL